MILSSRRPWQRGIVTRILEEIESGSRRWIIDAPAGSGKTLIAMDLSEKLLSQSPDLKAYVAVRTHNEITPYDETKRKFNIGLKIKFWVGKKKLCDVYGPGDETNLGRCQFDTRAFVETRDGIIEIRPARKREDRTGLDDYYHTGLQGIYGLVDKSEICPYLSNRYRTAPFNVITYNYLLDDGIRTSSRIDLSKSLVIVDEAHNLESFAAAPRAQLKVRELDSLPERYSKLLPTVHDVLDRYGSRQEIGSVPSINDVRDSSVTFRRLIERFSRDDTSDKKEPLQPPPFDRDENEDHRSNTKLLDKSHFTAATKDLDDEFRVLCGASAIIDSARNILMVTRSRELRDPFHAIIGFVNALQDDEGKDAFGLFAEGRGMVSLRPIDPAQKLAALNEAKFLVMMSGTMPERSYIDLVWGVKGLNMISVLKNYNQEYRSIFPRDNLVIRVIDDRAITTNYNYRKWKGESLWRDFARLIDSTHVAHSSGSTLVCVPSYSIANSIFEHLKVESKFVETRETSIEGLKKRLLSGERSRIIMAVSRGKLLEGVELVENGRSLIDLVIIAGIPYPVPDDRYKLQRFIFLRKLGIPQDSKEAKELEETYLKHLPALNTVKQAIGRAIRNPEDRAFVLLADHRFNSLRWRRDLGLDTYHSGRNREDSPDSLGGQSVIKDST